MAQRQKTYLIVFKKDKTFYTLLGLVVISLFVNLGIQPLYLEEPRRALIALEMIFRNNYIVPSEFGVMYYNKPPLWNWMIILAYKIFGTTEFAVRFFSVFSLIFTTILVFKMGKKYVNTIFASLSALFYIISVDIYFYFSATGEIDLFYSLICFSGFITIFHFYEKQQYFKLFLLTYLFAALGTLTKGLPSIAFAGLSLLVFFIYKKDFKRLFSLAHFAGIGLFLILVGGYILIYSRFNDPSNLLKTLWSEASNRTATSNGFSLFLKHLFIFPLDLFKIMMPAGVFIVFLFKNNFLKTIKSNRYIQFSAIIFMTNILIYWFSPGTRPRYVYMLLPLAINVLIYFYMQFHSIKFKLAASMEWIWGAVIISLIGVSISLFFIKEIRIVPNYNIISAVFALIFSILFYIYIKKPGFRLITFILAAIVLRFAFDLTVLKHRSLTGGGFEEKQIGIDISEISGNTPVKMYKGSLISRTSIFYIEKNKGEIVQRTKEINTNDYFICHEKFLENQAYTTYKELKFKNVNYFLVKFKYH